MPATSLALDVELPRRAGYDQPVHSLIDTRRSAALDACHGASEVVSISALIDARRPLSLADTFAHLREHADSCWHCQSAGPARCFAATAYLREIDRLQGRA